MTPFLESILAFPTVFFTILMGVTLTYWLCVILGAVGIDALDADVDVDVDLAAGAKAAGGLLEGGAKAAGGLLEGGAKAASGVFEGADGHAGHGHAGHGHDHDADGDGSGLFASLGFAGIPVTISFSFVIFAAWILSIASRPTAFSLLGSILPGAVVGGGLFVLCSVLGTLAASLAVRPLRPVFIAKQAPGRDSLMGRVCTINSGSVDTTHGHATFEDGGAGLILNVFCDRDNQLKRGDKALILGYDPARDVYEVEPVDFLLPEEIAQIHDPVKATAIAARARDRVH
ncbi:hypothetical protein [Hyalangium sp.]|uniref:hypothetical protein n=1 Tax=Hyalangium sp. TaxID=2028555 RepID=UPI002D2AFF88|nr:hypothetical protein [Hyalangium sp.]HYI02256.1 hypothetical protein [Hyalangium sp.]